MRDALIEDARDVRVSEFGQNLNFAAECREYTGRPGTQSLEGEDLVGGTVAGSIDDAHGAGSDHPFHGVRSIERPRDHRHEAVFLSLVLLPRKRIECKKVSRAAKLQVARLAMAKSRAGAESSLCNTETLERGCPVHVVVLLKRPDSVSVIAIVRLRSRRPQG